MSIQINLKSLEKTEPLMVIKNEPPECEIVEIGVDNIPDSSEEKIIPFVKDIDIVYHPLREDSIKSENKHSESVETQVLVKTEHDPLVKIENITESENVNKTADTGDRNINKSTDRGVVEVEGSAKHFNTLGNLETKEQLILNFSSDLNSISTPVKHSKKTDVDECYKTLKTTLWVKDNEQIKVIKAPVIPVEPHEYTSLAKDKHICNHCQRAFNSLDNLKRHIKRMHKKVTAMYQCPFCPYKSKWSVRKHIIQKHKDTKDIKWFQCHLCEKRFKLKYHLTQHIQVHTDGKKKSRKIEFCPFCGTGFTRKSSAKCHMRFVHNKEERNKEKRKPQECKYTSTKRQLLEHHMKNTHKKHEKMYYCDKCDYETGKHNTFKRHKLIHLKPEEIQYFYCYNCSYKSKRKNDLKDHISRHFKNEKIERVKRYFCDQCDYETRRLDTLKGHKITHLKPEEIEYFYCYHCSYKSNRKKNLKGHIFRHFKNGDVPFHCYICNYIMRKREAIVKHIRKHSKVKSEIINEGS